MSKLQELKQMKNSLVQKARALLDKAKGADVSLSEEEQDVVNALYGQIDDLNAKIKLEERQLELEREIATDSSQNPSNPESRGEPRPLVLAGDEDRMKFESLGEQLKAIVIAGRSSNADVDPRLNYLNRMGDKSEKRSDGYNEAVPSDGGFAVQPDFIDGIMRRAEEGSMLLNRTNIKNTTRNGVHYSYWDETSRAHGSRFGGVRGYWVEEGEELTKSKGKLGEFSLRLKKLAVLSYVTDEQLEDVPLMEADIHAMAEDELGFLIDDSIVRGNGAGQPLGYLNSDCLVTVSKETGQKADSIVYENLIKMESKLWARSQTRGIWLTNQECIPELKKLALPVGTGGELVKAYRSTGPGTFTLDERPGLIIEQASALGDVGDISLVDLSQYMIARKQNTRFAASIHLKFLSDQMAFRWIIRINGAPTWKTALTPFKAKSGNKVSPFVTLAARS